MYKPFFIHILLFLLCCNGYTQVNLVPNPSFEDTLACPNSNSLGGIDQLAICTGNWYTATMLTPDYFHNCSDGSVVGVPNNTGYGFQYAYEGIAYGGGSAIEILGAITYSEYIETKLATPLEPCATYEVSFHVSLADYSGIAVKQIGALFTVAPYFYSTYELVPDTPQIKNTGNYLSDTSGWMQIIGTFKAKGCEEYIVLGYFPDDYPTDSIFIQPTVGALCCRGAYYYYDNVSVTKVASATEPCDCKIPEIPNVFTPNGDGINDELIIKDLPTNAIVQVVNRWGTVVREYDGMAPPWDGKNADGNDCTEGVYYVVVKTPATEYKGLVHLFR